MQIPHRIFVGFLAGIALGVGSTVIVKSLLGQDLPQPSKPQARLIPALNSPLLLMGEPALGATNAPLTIVEFSDFECSYCRRFHEKVFPQLKSEYIDTGLVRFVQQRPASLPPAGPTRSRSRTLCWRSGALLGLVFRLI